MIHSNFFVMDSNEVETHSFIMVGSSAYCLSGDELERIEYSSSDSKTRF